MQLLGQGEHISSGRKVVLCWEVEARVFGDSSQTHNHEIVQNGMSPKDIAGDESSDQTSDEDDEGGVPLAGHVSPISLPKIQSTGQADLTPQQIGRQRAANREKVRQAARRGAVFGFAVQGDELLNASSNLPILNGHKSMRRKVEAIQGGRVVEASFAKGEWGVRWRDDEG